MEGARVLVQRPSKGVLAGCYLERASLYGRSTRSERGGDRLRSTAERCGVGEGATQGGCGHDCWPLR